MSAILRKTVLTCLLLAAVPAAASNWCGENGVIRFTVGDDETPLTACTVAPDGQGLTRLTLHVWLTDVAPVAVNGEAFLRMGGFEFKLLVEGAEAFVTGEQLPEGAVNMANGHFEYLVGMQKPLKFKDGKIRLGTWELMFQSEPADVRISIAPEGVLSCRDTEGCDGSGTRALYIGSYDSDMLGEIFGAACQPLVLNPSGEVDTAPEGSASTWQKVGRAEAREARF